MDKYIYMFGLEKPPYHQANTQYYYEYILLAMLYL